MFGGTHSFYKVRQEVLGDQGYAYMRGDSYIIGWETHPHMTESLILYCLSHCVEDVLVGECAVGELLHFLDLCFGIVERQTAEG